GIEVEAVQKLVDARLGTPALAIVVNLLDVPAAYEAQAQRGCGRQLRFLFDQYHARAVGDAQLAVIEAGNARDGTQQRRLAAAVATDQSDAFAGADRKRGAVEQRHVAVGELRIEQREQGHRASVYVRGRSEGGTGQQLAVTHRVDVAATDDHADALADDR